MNPSTIKSISKVFPNINKERSESYSDYDNFVINWSNPESYQLVRRVGRGKYSDVFLAVDVRVDKDIIIKVLKPVRKRKIRREIKVLENVRGHPNIISLLDVTLSERGIPSLIFEYLNCSEHSKFSSISSLPDIQFYMRELAMALQFSHSNGIMHRDVKPQNIIVDFSRRILKLIDWGLAEFYMPCMNYNVRVASRYYKSPELLIDYQYYDYSLDIWSYGCVLAGLIFQKNPFFEGADNKDQLVKIIKVLGTPLLRAYLAKYRHFLSKDISEQIKEEPGIPFESLVNKSNAHLAHPEAISLVQSCLMMDHSERLTAQQVLDHEFFKITLSPTDPLCCDLN